MIGPLLPLLLANAMSVAPTAADVARLQYGGDAETALRLAELALAARPDDVSTRLAGACAAIECGHLERARSLLTPLERRHPVPPRLPVLQLLARRRATAPAEGVMRALAVAWGAAGRPDLSGDEPALGDASLEALPAATWTGARERLLFAPPADADERAGLAVQASAENGDWPLVLSLAILGGLAHQPCPADSAGRNAAVERAMRAARLAQPGNGYVLLAGRMARCPAEPGSVDVALLAEAADLPEFGMPRARVFEELLGMAQRAGRQDEARRRAISAWLALDVAPLHLQRFAAAPSLEPALRCKVGNALEVVGWRLTGGSAWLEVLMGVTLARRGAEVTGSDARIEQARLRGEAISGTYRSWAEASNARGRWPFAAEWREWTPDEVGASRAFLEAIGEPPGR